MSSNNKDTKVVEMRFENKAFESNVKTSLSTLDKLKQALKLDGATKGLGDVQKSANSLNFGQLGSNVESIANRFSTLGIMGQEVLRRLANAAIDTGKKLATSVIDPIYSGGLRRASNIEKAKFSMEGLGVEWEKIYDDIDYSVSGTAYSLDAAASAASSLVASGVEFGDTFGETGNSPMAKALRGISGVAAQTSSEFEDISRIFTTVAGNGRLMGDQLNQFAGRGLNVAAELTKYFNSVSDGSKEATEEVTAAVHDITGGMQITEQDLRELVSDGKISFKLFSEAMDSAFGEHAKDANKTFTGAMSNIKAALSRIGADFITPFISVEDNATNLVGIFNAVREKINEVRKALAPVVGPFANAVQNIGANVIEFINKIDVSPINEFAQAVANLLSKLNGNLMTRSLDRISSAGFDVYESITQYLNGVNDGSIETTKAFKSTVEEVTNGSRITTKELAELAKNGQISFGMLSKAMANTWGVDNAKKILDGTVFGKALEKITTDVKEEFTKVEEQFESTSGTITMISEREAQAAWDIWIKGLYGVGQARRDNLAAAGYDYDRVQAYVNDLYYANFDLEKTTIKVGEASEKAYSQAETSIESATEATEVFKTSLTPIEKIFAALHNIADAAKNVFSSLANIGKAAFSAFKEVFTIEDASNAILDFSEALYLFTENLKITEEDGEKFKSVFKAIFTVIKTVKDIIAKLITTGLKVLGPILGIIGEAILNVATFISNAIINLKEFISESEVFRRIGQLLKRVVDGVVNTFTNLKSVIHDAVKAIGESEGFKRLSEELGKIWDIADKFLGEKLGKLLGEVEDFADSNWGDTAFEKFVSLISDGASHLADFLQYVREGTGPFKDFIDKIKSSDGPLGKIVGFLERSGEAIKGFFEGFGKGEGASPIEKIKEFFVGIWDAITNFFKNLDLTGSAESIKDSIKEAFISAIDKLGVDPELLNKIGEFFKNLWSSIKDIDWGKMAKAGIAIFSLLKSIQLVKSVTNITGSIGKVSKSIGGFFTSLGKAAKNISYGILLLGLAGAMLMIAKAVKMIAEIPAEDFERAASTIVLMIGELIGAIAVSGKVGGAWQDSLGTGGMFLGIALSMLLIAKAIEAFANISDEDVKRSGKIIIGFMAAIAIASRIAGKSFSAGTGIAFAGMGLAVLLLVPAFKALGNMKWDQIKKGAVALGVVLGELALAMRIAGGGPTGGGGKFGFLGMAASFLAIAIAVNIIIPAFMLLARMPWESILKGAVALGAVLFELAGAVRLATGGDRSAFAELLVMAVLVVTTAMALAALSLISWESLLKSVLALGIVFFSIGEAVKKASTGKAAIGNLLMMEVLLITIGAIFYLLKDIPSDTALALALGLSGPIIAIAGAIKLLQNVPLTAGLKAGLAVAEFIGIMAAVVAAAALIAQIPGANEFMASGEGILTSIGRAIGGLIGGILGGIAAGMTSALPKIALHLSMFSAGIKPFIRDVKEMADGDLLEAIGVLVAAFLAITAADFIDSLNVIGNLRELFGGKSSVQKVGGTLVQFAFYMKRFFSILGDDFDADSAKKSADAAKTLAEFAQEIPNEGGLLAKLTGDNTLKQWAEGLVAFAPAYVNYSNIIADANNDAVIASQKAIESIIAFSKEIPNQGGFLAELLGDNTLAQYAKGLVVFAPAYVGYSNLIAKANNDAVIASEAAINSIIAFSKEIPNQGGFLAELLGDNTLSQFAQGLADFALPYVIYSMRIAKADNNAVTNSETAINSIIALSKEIPNQGGLLAKLIGDNTISQFGEGLVSFADQFVAYSNKLSEIDFTQVNRMSTITERLVDTSNEVKSLDYARLDQFGSSVLSYGIDLSNYYSHISKVTFSTVDSAVDATYKLIDVCVSMKGVDTTVVSNFGKSLENVGNKGVDGFVKAFKLGKVKAVAAIASFLTTVQTSVNNTTGIVEKIKSAFHPLGIAAAVGFARGMDDPSGKLAIRIKAMAMAREALKAAKEEIDSNSPSKKFMELGEFGAMGFAIGLGSLNDEISKESSGMADSALNGMMDAIAKANSVIEDESLNPVITPVVDLSNVRYGASQINGLLGNGHNLGGLGVYQNGGIYATGSYASGGDVIKTINDIKRTFTEGVNKLSQMQVVLDTGEFVGATKSLYSSEFAMGARRVR